MNHQLRLLKRQIKKHITKDYIFFVVINSVQEYINKASPETEFLMGISIGEAKTVGAFWKVDWVVGELISMAIARGARALAIDIGVEPSLNPDIAEVLKTTDALHMQTTEPLKQKLLETFGDGEVDREIEQKLYAKWIQNVRNAMLGATKWH